MKHWISILVLAAMTFSQGAEAFHDHPVTESPMDCVICNHTMCFSLPATADVLPAQNQEVLGRFFLENLSCGETAQISIIGYAPKTSPPQSQG